MRLYHLSIGFTLILILLSITTSAQSVQYKVIPITSPYNPPGAVLGSDINKWGEIALTDVQNGQHQAFVWQAGKGVPLSLLGGPCGSAVGINNAGHIVGGACPPGETLPHAYIYRKKTGTRDLGTFGGVAAAGIAVNRVNQVAGNYGLSDGTFHGFFWNRNGWSDLGNLGGSFTYVFGINDSAVVTGQSDISNDPDPVYGIPHFHGFQWVNGVLTDFGSIFGSDFNYGNNINNSGLIVGSADLAGDVGAHAIVWNQGTVQDLTPYGQLTAWALDVNTQGDIVGAWGSVDTDPTDGPPVETMLCPCYATLWRNGQATFLQDVVPTGWELLLGLGISDNGDIVAYGSFNGGKQGRVLLKPVKVEAPESAPGNNGHGPTNPASVPRLIRRDHDSRFFEIR